MSVKINIHFGGGAELLFDKIKKREVELPALSKFLPNINKDTWTIRELLDESVRPGILVLINDADWELYGELDYSLKDND
ncbi:Uncharacterized protein OBRU01_04508, partial [Operophtera brumata]